MNVRAFMPPQGLLVVAAALPHNWDVRFIDENVAPASDDDYRWADVVFTSGMHVQRQQIGDIIRRAHQHGRLTVLGGPSASACPEWYPQPDIIHIGELGDATRTLIERIECSIERPSVQELLTTRERLPLQKFPTPRYDLINLRDYFLASVQFSSGCPFHCEFCDIPALYGRNPRLKRPAQVIAELDAMLERGNPGCVYFVDDNFIGNQKAALSILEELVRWQTARGYPVQFACEATLNLARSPKILTLMREAAFTTVFCGIETPEENALRAMHKEQNLQPSLVDAIRTINSFGLEVVSGIILGLDTDSIDTGQRIRTFINESQIPLLTINILHALPRTPLWERLQAVGRIVESRNRPSNVAFLLPDESVIRSWRDCVTEAYQPAAVYSRFSYQALHTFPNRKRLPLTRARVNVQSVLRGMGILRRLLWMVGVRGDYRREFWKMMLPLLRRGRIEEVIHIGVVSHHLIKFARECAGTNAEMCFYSRLDEPSGDLASTAPHLSERSGLPIGGSSAGGVTASHG